MSYWDKGKGGGCVCVYLNAVKCRDHWGDREGRPVRKPEDRKLGYEDCSCPCHPHVAHFIAGWLVLSMFGCIAAQISENGYLLLLCLPGVILFWPALYRA